MTFEGNWTLIKSETFSPLTFGAEQVWQGSFMECMTVVAYENLGPLKFNFYSKIIVALCEVQLEKEEEI